MKKINVLNVNNNETEAILNEWLVEDNSYVKKGDLIAVLETTKATVDIEAEEDGKIKIIGQSGISYEFGSSIGWIYQKESDLEIIYSKQNSTENNDEYTITTPALKFINDNNIDKEEISKLGLKIIKVKDIEHLANNLNSDLIKIDPKQITIGNTVSNSKFSIPDAFNLKKIYVKNAQNIILDYSEKNKIKLGIPELLIFKISRMIENFNFFNGTIIKNNSFLISQSCNIGVTIDLGKGLFIPVIQNSEKLSIKEITTKLMDYKMKALRDSFKSEDFLNPSITISLNMDKDTVLVQPIIFPGQTCMISISAIFDEIIKDGDNFIETKYINLGLAYDHRVINGFEANNFLTNIKTFFEEEINLINKL